MLSRVFFCFYLVILSCLSVHLLLLRLVYFLGQTYLTCSSLPLLSVGFLVLTYCWAEVGFVHSSFADFGFSLLCLLSCLLHLAFCLSTYSADLHLRTVVLPCLLMLPVVLLKILGWVDFMVFLAVSISVFFVWLAFSFGLWSTDFVSLLVLPDLVITLRLVSLSPLV